MRRQGLIGGRTVEIIGIDHRKGATHLGSGHQRRMARAPGFGPPGRSAETSRQCIHLLKNIPHLHPLLEPPTDRRPEVGLDVFADDEHQPVEPRPQGV
jgi:hypothetical protein